MVSGLVKVISSIASPDGVVSHTIIVRIKILRSEAASSAGKMTISIKFSKKADFSSECCYKLTLKLLLVFSWF